MHAGIELNSSTNTAFFESYRGSMSTMADFASNNTSISDSDIKTLFK